MIILYKAESGLVRQCADGSGAEGMTRAENHLGVIMGMALVLTGEVQVDIRLLIPLESKESLEGNVKSLFIQRMSADRTNLVGHVTAGTTAVGLYLVGIKIHIVALRTDVVGAQGIYLGDIRHGRHER